MNQPRRFPATAKAGFCAPSVGRMAADALKRAFERSKTGIGVQWSTFGAVAANEAPEEAAVDVFNEAVTAMATNASSIGSGSVSDEGVLSVPFGDHKIEATGSDGKKFWCWQRLDATALNEMKTGWRGILQKFAFWVMKIPIYEGHPDRAEALNEDQKDELVRGTVKSIDVGQGELSLPVAWNEAGKKAVGNYTSISPHWWLKETGETKDGLPVMRPCLLVSIGLTNKPNIAGSAINEEEPNQENTKMKELIAKLRADLKLDATMTDEEVLRRAIDHYGEINQQLWEAKNKLEEAERLKKQADVIAAETKTELTAAQVASTAANERATAAETALAAAQAAATAANEAQATAAAGIVDAAITAGKIPLADRQGWLDRFAANPIEAAAAAANEAPRLKTEEGPAAAANERREVPPMQQFQAAVREHMATNGLSGPEGYNAAWAACRKTHAAIFAQIKS